MSGSDLDESAEDELESYAAVPDHLNTSIIDGFNTDAFDTVLAVEELAE